MSSIVSAAFSGLSWAILLTLVVWLVKTVFTGLTTPLKDLPGPWISRFTNLRLKLAVIQGRRIFYIDELHQRYGPFVRIAPGEVAVADPAAFKTIHAVSSKFTKDIWYERLTNFPRLSVFSMRSIREHGQRRRLYARGFSKTYLREHWESTIRRMARTAVDKIKAEATIGTADLMRWWTYMSTDIIGTLGFGESFGMLELGKRTEYIRILEAALVGNGIGAEMPWLRSICARMPIQALEEAFNSSDYLINYGTKALDNARRYGTDANLMANSMAEAEKAEAPLDDEDVRTDATSLIFAGSGTTANSLVYLCYSVLLRAELQEALEQEVATLPSHFTDADAERLPLLNAVINETLRLYAAVPGSLPRVVPQGGVTFNGVFLPEGVTVSTQAYTYHRDKTLWTNPEAFDPSRWLESDSISPGAKSTFCAFGAGATSCLGINLAWMELRYATAFFFRECRGLRLAPTTTPESMEMENYFVITPKSHRCEVTMSRKLSV